MSDISEREMLEALADDAIDSGVALYATVVTDGIRRNLVAIPDVEVLEALANGDELDLTRRFVRNDGRSAAVFASFGGGA
jgi:hypothetical protein